VAIYEATLTVPAGAAPGDMLPISLPPGLVSRHGGNLRVPVPAGAEPGAVFGVEVPVKAAAAAGGGGGGGCGACGDGGDGGDGLGDGLGDTPEGDGSGHGHGPSAVPLGLDGADAIDLQKAMRQASNASGSEWRLLDWSLWLRVGAVVGGGRAIFALLFADEEMGVVTGGPEQSDPRAGLSLENPAVQTMAAFGTLVAVVFPLMFACLRRHFSRDAPSAMDDAGGGCCG
jgi:hypothetical protein